MFLGNITNFFFNRVSVVEEGRASDLLAQEGWYYEQYQRQQKQEGE